MHHANFPARTKGAFKEFLHFTHELAPQMKTPFTQYTKGGHLFYRHKF